jgi:hypothetical protein
VRWDLVHPISNQRLRFNLSNGYTTSNPDRPKLIGRLLRFFLPRRSNAVARSRLRGGAMVGADRHATSHPDSNPTHAKQPMDWGKTATRIHTVISLAHSHSVGTRSVGASYHDEQSSTSQATARGNQRWRGLLRWGRQPRIAWHPHSSDHEHHHRIISLTSALSLCWR